MKIEADRSFNSNNETAKTVRLDRRYRFETPDESESFADRLGTVISFPNLAVYVDPIMGQPEASVTIECRDDVLNLATAYQLLDSFDEMHTSPKNS
jgi:hypothetical protein